MIAPVLHLHISACALGETIDQMRRGLLHVHDVGDFDARMRAAECVRLHFLGIADDAADFRHRRKPGGIDLRGAAGHDDFRVGIGAGPQRSIFVNGQDDPALRCGRLCARAVSGGERAHEQYDHDTSCSRHGSLFSRTARTRPMR